MPIMSFIPELKDFLLKTGYIYTVRKYRMGKAIVDIEGVGRCNRIPLEGGVTRESLLPYVESSGFSSVEDWWTKIRHFTPDKSLPLYLYRVEIKQEEIKV